MLLKNKLDGEEIDIYGEKWLYARIYELPYRK